MVFSPPSAREFQQAAEKVKIVIRRPRFRWPPKNLSVKSFSRSVVGCSSPTSAPQGFMPHKPDHSDRDNALGEYRTSPDSLPRHHHGLLASSAARIRRVALKRSQPFTCDRNARRPAMAHPLAVSSPQDSRNSALRLAKCSLRSAAKSEFCGSAQRRVGK